jgi:hypothetical protein
VRVLRCAASGLDWDSETVEAWSCGMRGVVFAACAALLAYGVSAHHAAHSQGSRPELTNKCNAQADSRKLALDARQSFMNRCLSGKPTTTMTPQQQKLVTCNAQAAAHNVSGDARQQFINGCVKS